MEYYNITFFTRQCKVFLFRVSWKVVEKTLFLVKNLKQKRFPRNLFPRKLFKRFCKILKKTSVVECMFRKPHTQAFNFTKGGLDHVVSPWMWKIFTTAISWTPAPSNFHYYVIPQSFLLATSFYLYLFWLQHWEMTSDILFHNVLFHNQNHVLFLFFRVNTNCILLNGVVWFILVFYTPGSPRVKFLSC